MEESDKFKEYLQELLKKGEEFNNTKVSGALIGQSGSGKSSLINALIGENICNTGTIETTLEKNGPYSKNGVSFYDLPGCGTTKFPKEDYVDRMGLSSFDFIILVTANRFYENDLFLIEEVKKLNKPIFIVRTKIDQSIDDGKFNTPKKSEIETLSECLYDLEQYLTSVKHFGIYLTSSRQPTKYDLGKLITEISQNLTNLKRDKFIAEAFISNDEILKKKRKIALKMVMWISAGAGVNGLNPIPGVDIAADIAILMKMNKEILKIYNLDEDSIDFLERHGVKAGVLSSMKSFAQKYLSKELVLIALKRFAPQLTAKTIAKYIPVIGQISAVAAAFSLSVYFGNNMINDCEAEAKVILEELTNSNI
ncbi:GTPase [Algoriphagus winogradskyi]|uniref:Interferon-inducible GTPase (IIGP) n=1 Tax=Algoriphagus winogradskyi TaxID=237017 RepID=A0ABY1NH65_9BACT|nr:GTPase [Algoriphagus winogradskyi]SMP09582.1 Interferon-inducible GTPase (IIGP) [Algoriphagus winogradskyi]